MDLAARKYNFIQKLAKVDENMMLQLELLLKKGKKQDWFEGLTIDEKNEIEIGVSQANENKLISNEEVISKFSKWH